MRTKELSKGGMPVFMVAAVMTVVAAFAGGAGASSIVVNDFSFESPNVADGTGGSLPASPTPAWIVSGFQGLVYDLQDAQFAGTTGDNANTLGVLPDGGQMLLSTPYFEGPQTSTISQDVGTVAADTIYTLTIAVGTRADLQSGGWKIELLAGATSIGSNTANSGPSGGTFVDEIATAGPFSVGNANVGQDLFIQISTFNAPGNTDTAEDFFDDVRLNAQVPDPATGSILLVASLLGLRRRRLPAR